jgi:hypothetical protein
MRGRLLIALAAASLLPAVAAAQSREQVERAKASFQAGATAYAAGDYLAAIQAFDAANAITPVPAIAFSLAQAERRQYFTGHDREHLNRAIALYRQYLEQVASGGRRADALDALSQLEPLAATGGDGPTPVKKDVVRPTRLMITSDAPGARLALDGGPPGASPLIREVEPGKHRVTALAPGFFPAEREVVAVAGELIPATVPLRERLSTVALSAPADAEIYVDGTFVSHGGAGVTLSLPSGPHRLAVAQKGHHVSSRVLELERGKAQSLQLTLEPTRQRRASGWLFVGAGGALGAGVVFLAMAVDAENSAKDFLAKRQQGNVTPAELDGYGDSVSRRNRYQMATAVTVAVAAGCALTGLLLRQFDQPIVPMASPDSLGVMVGARF